MHRVDRDYLGICISVAIKSMRSGKNGKGKHPIEEMRDDSNVSELSALILRQIDNESSFVCRAGYAPTDPRCTPRYTPMKFGVDEPWPEGCEPT